MNPGETPADAARRIIAEAAEARRNLIEKLKAEHWSAKQVAFLTKFNPNPYCKKVSP